jgi:hypothetical protein
MEKSLSNYAQREKDIDAKWQPIMDRASDALTTGDADLFAMVMAPELFMVSTAAQAAYEGAESLNSYLKDSGWHVPLLGSVLGNDWDGGSTTTTAGSTDQSLLQRLAGLFYIENAWNKGDLIVEQDENKLPEKEPDLKKALETFMQQTGIKDQFEKDAKDLLDAKKDLFQDFLDNVLPKLKLIKSLTTTADIEEFESALTKAQSDGLDLGEVGMDKISDEINSSAEKLAQTEEFRTQIAQEKGDSAPAPKNQPSKVEEGDETGGESPVPDVSDEEVAKAAMKVAFVNAKKDFDSQATEGAESLKKQASDFIIENSPSDQALSIIKKSKYGAEFIKILDDTKQKIQNV